MKYNGMTRSSSERHGLLLQGHLCRRQRVSAHDLRKELECSLTVGELSMGIGRDFMTTTYANGLAFHTK